MSATEMVSTGVPMPTLASVKPDGHQRVCVTWAAGSRAGRIERVDLSPLIGTHRLYAPLRDNQELFESVHLVRQGRALAWGDGEIDMSAKSVERLAREMMSRDEFADFLARNRLTRQSAAAALGYSIRQIGYFLQGREIPRVVALACIGYEALQARKPDKSVVSLSHFGFTSEQCLLVFHHSQTPYGWHAGAVAKF